MRRRSSFAFILVLGFVGLLTFGLISKGSSGPQIGDSAPQETFDSLDGTSKATLEDFEGRWVLVNFWASWCKPCEEEAPALEQLYKRYRGDEFTVIGIATRDASDDTRKFVEDFGLTYPQFRDRDGSVNQAWGTTGVPETFLVDPEGVVRVKQPGAVDEKMIDDLFISVLKEAGL